MTGQVSACIYFHLQDLQPGVPYNTFGKNTVLYTEAQKSRRILEVRRVD
jgi:hypothetical protein